MGQQGTRPHRLSATDRGILGLLEEDARRTVSEIAATLDVSRTTVRNRIDLMRQRGVIKRFTIDISPNDGPAAPPNVAFFLLKLNRPLCRLVYQTIRGWPELVQCWSISGETDLLVQVRAGSVDGVERLRDRLSRHGEVKAMTTLMVLKEWVSRLESREVVDHEPRQEAQG